MMLAGSQQCHPSRSHAMEKHARRNDQDGKEGLGQASSFWWHEEAFHKAWLVELDIRGISCSFADEVATLRLVAILFIDVISEGWEHFITTVR